MARVMFILICASVLTACPKQNIRNSTRDLSITARVETDPTNCWNGAQGEHKETIPPLTLYADTNFVLDASTLTVEVVDKEGPLNDSERCLMAFGDYEYILPGIGFPRHVQLTAKAQSYSGMDKCGHRGRTQCLLKIQEMSLEKLKGLGK